MDCSNIPDDTPGYTSVCPDSIIPDRITNIGLSAPKATNEDPSLPSTQSGFSPSRPSFGDSDAHLDLRDLRDSSLPRPAFSKSKGNPAKRLPFNEWVTLCRLGSQEKCEDSPFFYTCNSNGDLLFHLMDWDCKELCSCWNFRSGEHKSEWSPPFPKPPCKDPAHDSCIMAVDNSQDHDMQNISDFSALNSTNSTSSKPAKRLQAQTPATTFDTHVYPESTLSPEPKDISSDQSTESPTTATTESTAPLTPDSPPPTTYTPPPIGRPPPPIPSDQSPNVKREMSYYTLLCHPISTEFCLELPRGYMCDIHGEKTYDTYDPLCQGMCHCWDNMRGFFADDGGHNHSSPHCTNPTQTHCVMKKSEDDREKRSVNEADRVVRNLKLGKRDTADEI
ncbi:MAG: hypothetical protein Q9227_000230 [Pyrenula ochraceoflavens]